MRIARTVERPAAVSILVDGAIVSAIPGENVAAALFAAGVLRLRSSPRAGAARGMFCLMGSCQECVVWVDGRRVTACQEPVRAAMKIGTGAMP